MGHHSPLPSQIMIQTLHEIGLMLLDAFNMDLDDCTPL